MTYLTHTRVLRVDPNTPDAETIRAAAMLLRGGRLVAFPTETVYGLGANALDEDAINRIFSAKQRPASDPIIAHIDTLAQLDLLAQEIPPVTDALVRAFWPGALTLVLRRSPEVPANIAAGLDTLAVRMPAHPVARALLAEAGIPIAAPSANTFTRPSATTAAHVLEDLDGRVDLVLDGGATTIGLESTVLDLTQSPPVILRPGGVSLESLRPILPDVVLAPRFLNVEEAAVSPGQMLKHYAPRARMLLFTGELDAMLAAMRQTAQEYAGQGQHVGVLVADEEAEHFNEAVVAELGPRGNLNAISRQLFAGIRDLDSQGVDVILAHDFGRDGLGAALWDRLLRAAQGRVIEV